MTVARVARIAFIVPMMPICSPISVLTVFTIRKPDSTRAIADRTSRIVYRPLITLGSNWFPGRSAPSTATPCARSNAVTARAVSAAVRSSLTWISMSFGFSTPVAAVIPAWLIYARAKELKPADVLPSVRERPTTFSEVDPQLARNRDGVANLEWLQRSVARFHHDLADPGQAATRHLERINSDAVEVLISGNAHVDVARRGADLPPRRVKGHQLNYPDIGEALHDRGERGIHLVGGDRDIGRGSLGGAVCEGGRQLVGGDVDGGESSHSNHHPDHHQQRSQVSTAHVTQRLARERRDDHAGCGTAGAAPCWSMMRPSSSSMPAVARAASSVAWVTKMTVLP